MLIKELVRYKAWADLLFFDCVAQLTESQLVLPQPITFGSLIRTLNHSYLMDYAWKSNLLGTPHGLTTRNPQDHPPFNDLRAKQAEIDKWYIEYTDSLTQQELDSTVYFEFIGGEKSQLTRSEILFHVVNHTTYHRGHAAAMLYQFGISPPTTDFPVYLKQNSDAA